MNPELTLLKITGLLAAEVAAVCLLAFGCEVFVRSAVWRRTVWQVCVLSVLLVSGLELSGLGRSIGEFVRQTPPTKSIPPITPVAAMSPTPFFDSPPVTVEMVTKPAPPKDRTRQIMLALACVWIVGTGAFLCRIMLTRTIMLAICGRSRLVRDGALLRMVRELVSRMGMRGTIRVVESPRLRGPIAFGLARRVIGLPLNFAVEYAPEQQEVILAHELAHLAARDSWWQLLADATVAVLWWHPLVWLARVRLQDAAESAADESSLLVPDGPPVLAECLLAIGKRMERTPRIRWSGIGGDGFRSGLGRRVQRLLALRKGAARPRNRFQLTLAKTFCPAVLVLGTVLSSGWMSPAASMKGTDMKNPIWKRSLPAFALLALLGADRPIGAADKAAPGAASDKPTPPEAVSRSETKPAAGPKGRGAARVRHKLEQITMDIQADNLPLGAVINMLIDETRKRDPEKEGINILLYHSEVPSSVARAAIDPATGLPIPGTAPEPVDLNSITIRVMPPHRNVRLIDVFDVILKGADYPLRYSIEDYGVVITEARSKSTSDLETRTFVVNPPEIFFKGIKTTFGIDVSPSGLSRETQRQVFEELFRHLGLDWSSGKSVFYNELTGIVMVRAAAEDMTLITATMQTLGAMPLSEAPATAKTGKQPTRPAP